MREKLPRTPLLLNFIIIIARAQTLKSLVCAGRSYSLRFVLCFVSVIHAQDRRLMLLFTQLETITSPLIFCSPSFCLVAAKGLHCWYCCCCSRMIIWALTLPAHRNRTLQMAIKMRSVHYNFKEALRTIKWFISPLLIMQATLIMRVCGANSLLAIARIKCNEQYHCNNNKKLWSQAQQC